MENKLKIIKKVVIMSINNNAKEIYTKEISTKENIHRVKIKKYISNILHILRGRMRVHYNQNIIRCP